MLCVKIQCAVLLPFALVSEDFHASSVGTSSTYELVTIIIA